MHVMVLGVFCYVELLQRVIWGGLFFEGLSVSKRPMLLACRSSLQSLHKACEVARCHNYYPGSLFLTWISYYESRVSSDQVCINEWNAMQDVQSHRADSPVLFTDV